MKQRYLLLFPLVLVFSLINAQSGDKFKFPRGGTVDLASVTVDYMPLLRNLEAPAPDGNSEKARLAAMKQELAEKYAEKRARAASMKTSRVDTAADPWLVSGFRSNITINGVPNDNDMAVSTGGMVVSVINSNIWMHDSAGTNLKTVSLDAWSDTLGIDGSKFDPRALYDPVNDRFIVACLNGFADSTSYIIVGFSQTNDPTGEWNLYALPGDPRDDSLWTDYPIMALTEHELFITGNLLYNDQPWQTGFARSLCWQIDLDNAYSGDSLETMLWDSVYFGGNPIRNLCPIQGGSMPGGPNMYLLSNRNFDAQNDTVFIMEITDTMNSPGVQYMVDFEISNQSYGMPPNAEQNYVQFLATNDARWLDGFIENGNIQFVGNCIDTSTGLAAVYHGVITDITGARTTTGKIVAGDGLEYGYPGIAWFGMAPGTDESLIGINYTGPNAQTYPGCGAIYYDGVSDYSHLVIAKPGQSFINAISGVDRWGDYMGVQRAYNLDGYAWISGTWGPTNHLPATWVAVFRHPSLVGKPEPPHPSFAVRNWPNPFQDLIAMEFSLEASAFVEISLYDLQGRKVRTLLRDRAKSGRNSFTFSTDPLTAGTYLLQVRTGDGVLATKQVVKLK